MAHSEPGTGTEPTASAPEIRVVRVMVVDDHPPLARGVELSLQRAADIEVVSVLHRPREVLARVDAVRPDIILMDVRMPQREGIDLLIQIRSLMPHVKVIMLTASEDPLDIRDAMRMGAYGYVSKSTAWDQLLPIVRLAQRDQVVISRQALDPVLGRISIKESQLTAGELELLRLLVEVDNLNELAEQASMSRSTLSRNLERIQDKLGVKTRHQAIAVAARDGLI